ncbi:TolC family protein [bacterium]|nr:TolC family protein [bacterium]
MCSGIRDNVVLLTSTILLSVRIVMLNAQMIEKIPGETLHYYTLDDCIEMALEHHVKQRIALESLNIAEAQKKQALSAYWPQLSASAYYSVTDEEPTFIFPKSSINLPDMDFTVAEQHIKLMDNQNLTASLKLTMPLYTGGIVSALKNQAALGVQIAQNDIQKTRNEITRDVKKYYYAVVLTNHLTDIGQEAFDRLNATLDLTESLYKNGSGRVKKTDYLKNKLIVDNVKMLIVELQKSNKLAEAALKFSIGLPWNEPIKLAENVIPHQALSQDLDSYVHRMLSENLELKTIQLASSVFDQKLKESKGYLYPHIGLVGQHTRLFNKYNYGMMTPENKQLWLIGLGLNYSFFNGFRYKNKVQEVRSRATQLRHQYTLFKQGLTLMVQSHFFQLMAAQEGVEISKEVYATASENLELVKRAYRIEILTEKDLIEAQIIEALMKAKLEKSLYDHYRIRTDLEYLLAEQVTDFIKRNTLDTN